MDVKPPNRTLAGPGGILPPAAAAAAVAAALPALTPAGEAALAAAQALAKKATAPATLRAYKADWTHFADWCEAHGFVPVPAAPATVGAYLASLAVSHAPTTIRRRLSALGKMHRFNDLPWNPAHRDIQGPLQGVLRTHGRPVRKAAALTLKMLRQILATCDQSARGRRDRALLAVRLRRRAAPLGARGTPGRGRRCGARRAAAAHPPRKNRPGGAGGGDRPAARAICGNLPGAGVRGLAGGGQAQGRAAVPKNQHRRWDRRYRAASRRGSPNPGASRAPWRG